MGISYVVEVGTMPIIGTDSVLRGTGELDHASRPDLRLYARVGVQVGRHVL